MAKNFKNLAAPLYEDADSAKKIGEYKQAVEAELVALQLGELRRQLGVAQVARGAWWNTAGRGRFGHPKQL